MKTENYLACAVLMLNLIFTTRWWMRIFDAVVLLIHIYLMIKYKKESN